MYYRHTCVCVWVCVRAYKQVYEYYAFATYATSLHQLVIVMDPATAAVTVPVAVALVVPIVVVVSVACWLLLLLPVVTVVKFPRRHQDKTRPINL